MNGNRARTGVEAFGAPITLVEVLTAVGILVAAGLIAFVLLLDKSLKIGDFVELESGVTGEVRDIKIRATTIVTNDSIDILVPNSEFVAAAW